MRINPYILFKKYISLFILSILLTNCTPLQNDAAIPSSKESDQNIVAAAPKHTPAQTNSKFVVGKTYKMKGKKYKPAVDLGYSEVGIASWYGDQFNGKKTASGARFNKHSYTGAHRTLPISSVVRVTNLANNKSIELVVNDRGPAAGGKPRIIDVSQKAAEVLDFKYRGLAKVKVEYLHDKTLALLAHYPKVQQQKAQEAFKMAMLEQQINGVRK